MRARIRLLHTTFLEGPQKGVAVMSADSLSAYNALMELEYMLYREESWLDGTWEAAGNLLWKDISFEERLSLKFSVDDIRDRYDSIPPIMKRRY